MRSSCPQAQVLKLDSVRAPDPEGIPCVSLELDSVRLT
jgi:hypothetical protein